MATVVVKVFILQGTYAKLHGENRTPASARWSSNVTVALHFASLPLAEQAFSDSKAKVSGPCTCTISKVGQFSNIYELFSECCVPCDCLDCWNTTTVDMLITSEV
ncbi:hypothetical protein PAXRUDRAFT_604784 [Paxillus rubicundulus Ve08.2h10]|uniref:Uncharacterized protein n=1 Tax=Paxillus rubicundulus Ve08.2h10 TaxID=930991 RepID=A0A0D0CCQ9_9AGAM|nr:hypothetical protein PAXRUDRAFT_604784 [Paxillus rubicundulus Ve08.2h10]